MSGAPFDSETFQAGVTFAYAYIDRGERDFIRIAQSIARDMNTSAVDLRPFLRSWYSGLRHWPGIEPGGFWPEDRVNDAMLRIEEWGGQLYAPQTVAASQAKASAPATEEDLRRLMGLALTTPTPEAVMGFIDFTSKMKRLGPYNMMMVYTQRPGASAVASRDDWRAAGQKVRGDAILILILKPKGPIAQVFELADTEPTRERDPRKDAFAAKGSFDEGRLDRLIAQLARPAKRKLIVEVRMKDFGNLLAGRVHRFGIMADQEGGEVNAADQHAHIERHGRSVYSISLNRRLKPAEQFTTLLHELGHLFCGHLGAFDADNPTADEYGWPDRTHLPHATKEIEAELVAWHMAERENLVVGSPLYLKRYMENSPSDVTQVDLDRVVRAIARARAYLGDRIGAVGQDSPDLFVSAA